MAKRRLEDVEESLERARKMADTESIESRDALRRLQEEKDEVDRQVDLLRRNVRGKIRQVPFFEAIHQSPVHPPTCEP